jgi:hypothetical protein
VTVPFEGVRSSARAAVAATILVGAVLAITTTASAEPSFSPVKYQPTDVGGGVKGLEPYGSVSCPTTSACTAAGPANQDLGGSVASVVTQTSGVWGTPSALPLPANEDAAADAKSSSLNQISCWAVGDCVAVGDYVISEKLGSYPDTASIPMEAVETSGVWSTATAVPLPTGVYAAGDLVGVSCDVTGDCTALGWYVTIATTAKTTTVGYQTFVTTTTAGSATWTAPVLLKAPAGAVEQLSATAISCASFHDCTAAENVAVQAGSNFEYFTELVTETDGAWSSSPQVFGPVSKRPTAINALSCLTATSCVAVGYSSPTETDLSLESDMLPTVAVETAGAWSKEAVLALPVVSPSTNEGDLLGVSCLSAGNCEATGIGLFGTKEQYAAPVAVSLVSGSWSSLGEYSVPLKAGGLVGSVSDFTAVDCVTTTSCLALGDVSTGFVSSNNTVYGFSDLITPTGAVKAPGRPSNVKVGIAPTKVIVAYAPPLSDGGAPIKQFVVTATSPKEPTKTCTTSALSCGIVGAVNGHVYTVTVVAKNVAGTSTSTPPVTFKET